MDAVSRKRILFVDDEARILDGLRRMLRPLREAWETHFAESGEEGLKLLEAQPFDVAVSDMRMPQMDGAQFLAHVKRLYPSTIRIVLSGHSELKAAVRAVPVAHQFLSKPCEATVLRETIERACSLNRFLSSPELRRVVGDIDALPTLPRTYSALTTVLADAHATNARIAEVLRKDSAMSAKMLQLVNSSFFSLPRRITDVGQAVALLGVDVVRNLTLSAEVFRTFEQTEARDWVNALQDHALLVAAVARRIAADFKGLDADEVQMAALLHDVGKLILAQAMPRKLFGILEQAEASRRPMHAVELEVLGITHAELGAYLLGIWGLPYSIVEAVAHHHEPGRAGASAFDGVGVVHVANVLAREAASGARSAPDLVYLDGTGMTDRLEAWRAFAHEQASAAQEAQ